MYKKARTQRYFWSQSQKDLNKKRRAPNLSKKKTIKVNNKGYLQTLGLHKLFLIRAGLGRLLTN